jgi:hypothetical protein
VCNNRAATWANLLKAQENRQRRNQHFCRHFALFSNLQQSIILPSHGRGRWFDRASPTLKSVHLQDKYNEQGWIEYRLAHFCTSSTPTQVLWTPPRQAVGLRTSPEMAQSNISEYLLHSLADRLMYMPEWLADDKGPGVTV